MSLSVSYQAARRWPYVVAGLAITLYLAAYGWLSIARHQTYNSTGLDLGIYDQGIWNSAHGRLFASSIQMDNLLGDHVDFALLLYVPLFWLWPDVRVLLVAQTLVLASGAVPVFWLARRRLKSAWLGAFFCCLYLLYPGLGFVNRYDFHPEVLMLPALLGGLVFIEQRRWLPSALCLALATLCKEYIGLELAGYGAYIWMFAGDNRHMRRLALACIVAGPAWTAAMAGWLIPAVRSGLPINLANRYLWFLGVNVPNSNQITFLVFTKALFIVELFAPLLLLPLGALRRLVALLIPLAIVMASSSPAQASIYFQYIVEFIPGLFAATIYGLEAVLERLKVRPAPADGLRLGRLLVFGLGLAMLAFWLVENPFRTEIPPIYFAVTGAVIRPNAASLDAALRLIPPEGCVIASNHLVPQMSHRPAVYLLRPLGYTRPWPVDCGYAVADLSEKRWGDDAPALQGLLDTGQYQVIFQKDDVVVARHR